MSILQLQSLVPSPTAPTYVPNAGDWSRVESDIGVALPQSLRELCATYGTGTFRGTDMTSIGVGCPGSPSFVANLRWQLQRFRDIRGPYATDDDPFAIFPENDGILPLAFDEDDVWYCWVTKGQPDEWPILIRWEWGPEGMKVFDLPLSDLLVSLFERRIELPCFPLPAFVDDVQFLPYEAGTTIGEKRILPPTLAATVEVVHRGEVVGTLTNLTPDMWHLEGRFTPATTAAGERFVQTASAIDLGNAYEDYRAGLRTLLRESSQEGAIFVVMSFSEGRLYGRRFTEPAAIRWVLKHVPE